MRWPKQGAEWRIGPLVTQMRLFGKPRPIERQQKFDLAGVTDAQFFEQAESKVVSALSTFAEQAENGERLQRRLFAEDTVEGVRILRYLSGAI